MENILPPNQGYFIKSHISEVIQEQQRVNKTLLRSFHELSNRYDEQEDNHSTRWEELRSQLNQLQQMNAHHEIMEQQVMDQLKQADASHQMLQNQFEVEKLSKQQVMGQLEQLKSSQEMVKKMLESITEANDQLILKMDEQTNAQEKMSEEIAAKSGSNEKFTLRLDNQEAVMEKITRQIDYFRGLLFERTNYLSEKIDQTSSSIRSMTSGSDQQQKSYLISQKQKEKSNK